MGLQGNIIPQKLSGPSLKALGVNEWRVTPRLRSGQASGETEKSGKPKSNAETPRLRSGQAPRAQRLRGDSDS